MERPFYTLIGVAAIILSIPFHELCHLICLGFLGDWRSRKVTWLGIRVNGYFLEVGGVVDVKDGVKLSRIFRAFGERHPKLVGFVIGLSGGLGATIFLIPVILFLYGKGISIWQAVAVFGVFCQFLYGINEGIIIANSSNYRPLND